MPSELLGLTLLKTWIKNQKFATQAQAAEALQVHPVVLCAILKGTRRPGYMTTHRFQERAGVPMASWALRRLSRSRKRAGRVGA